MQASEYSLAELPDTASGITSNMHTESEMVAVHPQARRVRDHTAGKGNIYGDPMPTRFDGVIAQCGRSLAL